MRFVVLALLFGCSQLWGVDGYRAGEVEDTGVDSGVDAELDVGVDAPPDDATADVSADVEVDAMFDVGLDVEPDAFVDCIMTERDGGVVLMSGTVENTRFTIDTPGTAITARGPVTFRNVEIVVRNRMATGLVLSGEAVGSVLENVRVVFDLDDAVAPSGYGISFERVNNINGNNIEVVGMNIRLDGAAGINLNTLDMVPPGGFSGIGASSAMIEMSTVTTVTVDGFHLHSGNVFRAIDCVDCANTDFLNGFISVQATNWPFHSDIASFAAVNQFTNTAIAGSRRGVFLTGGEWDITNVQVERTADCMSGDYAFDVMDSGASTTSGVATERLCEQPPLRGAGAVATRPIDLTPMPAIEFCFERTGVVF